MLTFLEVWLRRSNNTMITLRQTRRSTQMMRNWNRDLTRQKLWVTQPMTPIDSTSKSFILTIPRRTRLQFWRRNSGDLDLDWPLIARKTTLKDRNAWSQDKWLDSLVMLNQYKFLPIWRKPTRVETRLKLFWLKRSIMNWLPKKDVSP